jgi:hypothetical protein
MPTIPNFCETLDNLKELHKKKNDDYSGDKGAFFNFGFCEYVSNLFTNGRDKVYAVFIAIKLARLAVLLSGSSAKNESIEDSFDDMITYATIWKCDYMSRMENEPIKCHFCSGTGKLSYGPDLINCGVCLGAGWIK